MTKKMNLFIESSPIVSIKLIKLFVLFNVCLNFISYSSTAKHCRYKTCVEVSSILTDSFPTLSEKQFAKLKVKIQSGKANIYEAYHYMLEAEGIEGWEIAKNLNPYLKKIPEPDASIYSFFIHLRLYNEDSDSNEFFKLRSAQNKFWDEISSEQKFNSELFILLGAIKNTRKSFSNKKDSVLFIQRINYLFPEYNNAGLIVWYLNQNDLNNKDSENFQSLKQLVFSSNNAPIFSYFFMQACYSFMDNKEWIETINNLPEIELTKSIRLGWLFDIIEWQARKFIDDKKGMKWVYERMLLNKEIPKSFLKTNF